MATYEISTPALHDHHSHVSLYASLRGAPSLGGSTSLAEARAFLGALPRDRLSLVTGWRSDRLAFRSQDLEDLPPLLIINFSLHGYLLTPAALPLVREVWPEFHERHRDLSWAESHVPELFAFYGRVAGLTEEALGAFMGDLAAQGSASAEDLSLTGPEALELILKSPFRDQVRFWASPGVYRGLPESLKPAVAGFKLFLDGAIGARSAALEGSFLGGETGVLLYKEEDLGRLLEELQQEGKALAVHAIGHRAIGAILDGLESLARAGRSFPEVRLEHVQFISQAQAKRCKELGLVLSMQPNFNADSADYADRLPRSLLEANNPFRLLIDHCGFAPGKDLVFGSDGMPHGLHEALQWSLFPPFPGQVLTVEELFAGYGPALGQGRPDRLHRFSVDPEARKVRRLS